MNIQEQASTHRFPKISEKRWLEKNRHYSRIDEKQMQSILYFGLIWNLFERECCDNFARIGTHPKELARDFSDALPLDLITPIFNYFKDRYITNGEPNRVFKNFKFGRNRNSEPEYKTFVQDALIDEAFNQRRAVQAVLYIAFRLRNNLFHGEKQIDKLYQQNQSFRHVNHLIMALIQLNQGRL